MAFTDGQLVDAADLNNLSNTTVTTSGAITAGTTLAAVSLATTGAITAGTTIAATGALSTAALLDLSGAASGQIQFPASQNASANAQTLDDYEEGAWTPTLGGTGGESGQVYTTQVGTYTKIGKLVTLTGRIVLSTLGTLTTAVQIEGFPFALDATANLYTPSSVRWENTTTALVGLWMEAQTSATVAPLRYINAAAQGSTAVVQATLANNTSMWFSFTYMAAA
jgi:hypothetical protein